MNESIRPISSWDICLWPCGTWCFRLDLDEYSWKSDDYEVIPDGTPRYEELMNG